MNKYEAIFGLSLATALVLDACSPAQATATEKPSTGDGGGQSGEVEKIPNLISDIRAEKIDLSQSEMDAFNTQLQNPETHVVKYVAQGNGYIVTEIDPEVRHDAVCLEQERWGVKGSDAVDLCSTLIEGQELILTNNDRDELVALMPFTVASGIEGYAGLAQDGKTIVPILARGANGEIYVYNQDTLQYHPLGGETQILDILDIDELFLKNGGGTVVDSRSRGVGHVTRLRFKNGIEIIQTPEGSFVSPEFIALQDRIAASGERLTLTPGGTIQDGAIIVPGLFVDKNGVMTLLQGDSSQVTISPESLSFDDEKGVSVAGYTLDEATGEWGVERPIKEFPWCKDMHLFEQCVINAADLQEHGRFAQSTLTEGLFDPEQVNLVPITPMSTFNLMNATFLTPNIETVPNYKIEATRPFKNQYMFGKTTIDGVEQYVIQVPYYIEGVVAQNLPVITGVNPVGAGGYKNSKAEQYLTQMNVLVWNITNLSLAIQYPNPKTGENFTMAEVQAIVEEMKVGNFANTDGLVLNFLIAGSTDGWFR